MDTPNALVLPHFVLSDRHERDELFNEWDEEGVAKLGLEALDRHCVLLWPHFNNRLALERAFRAVTSDGGGGGGGGGGDFVTRKTFRLLLKSVVFFNQRWAQFEDIQGTSGDCRLDRSEFTHALVRATPPFRPPPFSLPLTPSCHWLCPRAMCHAHAPLAHTAKPAPRRDVTPATVLLAVPTAVA